MSCTIVVEERNGKKRIRICNESKYRKCFIEGKG